MKSKKQQVRKDDKVINFTENQINYKKALRGLENNPNDMVYLSINYVHQYEKYRTTGNLQYKAAALQTLSTMKKIDSESQIVKYNQALIYMDQQNISEAIKLLNEADLPECSQHSLAYEWNGQQQKAIESYKYRIERDPSVSHQFINLGCCIGQKEQNSLAAQCFEKSRQMNPKWQQSALNNLGILYYKLGLFDQARYYFEEACNSVNTYIKIRALRNVAILYAKQNKLLQAELIVEEALKINTNSFQTLLLYGQISNLQKRYCKAKNIFEKAKLLRPWNMDVLLKQGQIEIELQNYSLAKQYIQKFLKLLSDSYKSSNKVKCIHNCYHELGRIYYKIGNYNDASQWFRQALQLNPGYQGGFYYLGNCFSKMQLHKEALSMYMKQIQKNQFEDAFQMIFHCLLWIKNSKQNFELNYSRQLLQKCFDWLVQKYKDQWMEFMISFQEMIPQYINQFFVRGLRCFIKLPKTFYQVASFIIMNNVSDSLKTAITDFIYSLPDEFVGDSDILFNVAIFSLEYGQYVKAYRYFNLLFVVHHNATTNDEEIQVEKIRLNMWLKFLQRYKKQNKRIKRLVLCQFYLKLNQSNLLLMTYEKLFIQQQQRLFNDFEQLSDQIPEVYHQCLLKHFLNFYRGRPINEKEDVFAQANTIIHNDLTSTIKESMLISITEIIKIVQNMAPKQSQSAFYSINKDNRLKKNIKIMNSKRKFGQSKQQSRRGYLKKKKKEDKIQSYSWLMEHKEQLLKKYLKKTNNKIKKFNKQFEHYQWLTSKILNEDYFPEVMHIVEFQDINYKYFWEYVHDLLDFFQPKSQMPSFLSSQLSSTEATPLNPDNYSSKYCENHSKNISIYNNQKQLQIQLLLRNNLQILDRLSHKDIVSPKSEVFSRGQITKILKSISMCNNNISSDSQVMSNFSNYNREQGKLQSSKQSYQKTNFFLENDLFESSFPQGSLRSQQLYLQQDISQQNDYICNNIAQENYLEICLFQKNKGKQHRSTKWQQKVQSIKLSTDSLMQSINLRQQESVKSLAESEFTQYINRLYLKRSYKKQVKQSPQMVRHSSPVLRDIIFKNHMSIVNLLCKHRKTLQWIAKHYGPCSISSDSFEFYMEKGEIDFIPQIHQQSEAHYIKILQKQDSSDLFYWLKCFIQGIIELQNLGIFNLDLCFRNTIKVNTFGQRRKYRYKMIDFDYAFKVQSNSDKELRYVNQTKELIKYWLDLEEQWIDEGYIIRFMFRQISQINLQKYEQIISIKAQKNLSYNQKVEKIMYHLQEYMREYHKTQLIYILNTINKEAKELCSSNRMFIQKCLKYARKISIDADHNQDNYKEILYFLNNKNK